MAFAANDRNHSSHIMPDSNTPKTSARSTNLETIVAEKEPLLHPDESIQQAGDKMRRLEADALPVSEGRRLVGMVDEPDPDRRAAGYGHDPNATRVSEIMNTSVRYCFADESCAEALGKMDAQNLDRLPVVDRQMRIVGVVTRTDVTECPPPEKPAAP
jgi:CBS domain-containing protein